MPADGGVHDFDPVNGCRERERNTFSIILSFFFFVSFRLYFSFFFFDLPIWQPLTLALT
jgi:hypothetical protein